MRKTILSLSFALIGLIAAFLLFRFFDIVKPFPINRVDRTYKNAFGIILDDIIASGYSIALIMIARELLG